MNYMAKTILNQEYKTWLQDLKLLIKRTQIKASISVNNQLIMLYWDLGRQIIEKQENAKWGSGFLVQLSKDLKAEFPEMAGFSQANIYNIRKFYLFYKPLFENYNNFHQATDELLSHDNQADTFLQQLAGKTDTLILHQAGVKFDSMKLVLVPWRHHIATIDKIKDLPQALFYNSINSPVGVSIFRYKELTMETKALLPTEEELLIELEKIKNDNL